MEYGQREFMIFGTSELPLIDFTQVLETSIDTVRKSVDETKTFVKWDGEIVPSSVDSLTTKEAAQSSTLRTVAIILGLWPRTLDIVRMLVSSAQPLALSRMMGLSISWY